MLDEHPTDYESNVFVLNTKFKPNSLCRQECVWSFDDKYFERCINCVG